MYKEFLPGGDDEEVLEFTDFECSASFDEKMYSGISLKSEERPTIDIKDSTKRPPDFLSGLGTSLPIVSESVRDFLSNTDESEYFEFIELVLNNYDKEERYFILNILEVLDAFDWEKSDYDLFDELGPQGNKVISILRKTVLESSKTQGRNLFYLKDFPAKLFISEQLEQAFHKAGIEDFRTLEI
jgi:hypothetical protein